MTWLYSDTVDGDALVSIGDGASVSSNVTCDVSPSWAVGVGSALWCR